MVLKYDHARWTPRRRREGQTTLRCSFVHEQLTFRIGSAAGIISRFWHRMAWQRAQLKNADRTGPATIPSTRWRSPTPPDGHHGSQEGFMTDFLLLRGTKRTKLPSFSRIHGYTPVFMLVCSISRATSCRILCPGQGWSVKRGQRSKRQTMAPSAFTATLGGYDGILATRAVPYRTGSTLGMLWAAPNAICELDCSCV